MKFSEFEKLMSNNGINTLAEIARHMETTPQAVSNWKSRDQVPYHIISRIKEVPESSDQNVEKNYISKGNISESEIALSDILLTIAEQLKIIILIPAMTVFIVFTYVLLIQKPLYVSEAKILVPFNSSSSNSGIGGLAGLASQFGVSVPTNSQINLSSPSLLPDIVKSRTFAMKVLEKEFYTRKFDKKMPLLSILTHGIDQPGFSKDTLITKAKSELDKMIKYEKEASSNFSIIRITAEEPIFARDLGNIVIKDLEELNRFFKSKYIEEKTEFIENRISSVKKELEASEKGLKEFKEQNRQVISPALQLEEERRNREVEVQKGVFLTLKQQLELAKIEEIQEASILQVLDEPQIPLYPINKNLKLSVALALIIGLAVAILLAFTKAYINNNDVYERKKLRRVRNFIRKKSKDFIHDERVLKIAITTLLLCFPYYLLYESQHPVYFNRYSPRLLAVNILYFLILVFISSMLLFIKRRNSKIKQKGFYTDEQK